MKSVLLSILLLVPSTAMSDAGVSVSYRSTPVIVEKNWLNTSNWPAEAAYYEGNYYSSYSQYDDCQFIF